MKFDVTGDKIILISYPSGGFGNFIYYVLSTFALETVKTNQHNFEFNSAGDSHAAEKYTSIWYKNPINYAANTSIDPENSHILVLCDNGINDDGYTYIRKVFTNAKLVRLTISDSVRPVIYKTCVYKAMQSDLFAENLSHIEKNWLDADKVYSQRENFTLMYHNWPFGWSDKTGDVNVDIENLIKFTKNTIIGLIDSLNLTACNLQKLDQVIENWHAANKKYFEIYQHAELIIQALKNKINISLEHITDLHDQGYINFLVEKHYNVIIPVYDYRNWFANTDQILNAIQSINEEKNSNSK